MASLEEIISAIYDDVEMWWIDNADAIILDTLAECQIVKESELGDAEFLAVVDFTDDGPPVEIGTLGEIVQEYTEEIIKGILNVIKTCCLENEQEN